MITAQPAGGAWQPLGDGLAAAERLLAKLRHDPGAIAATVGAPVVLVVIFGYIFGSAISVPGGGNYRAYLVSGLFAVIAANILPSMVAVARDSARGGGRPLPVAADQPGGSPVRAGRRHRRVRAGELRPDGPVRAGRGVGDPSLRR